MAVLVRQLLVASCYNLSIQVNDIFCEDVVSLITEGMRKQKTKYDDDPLEKVLKGRLLRLQHNLTKNLKSRSKLQLPSHLFLCHTKPQPSLK